MRSRIRFLFTLVPTLFTLSCAQNAIKPPEGPFACTELIGLYTSGEWYDAGFEEALGADLGEKWQGRFSHYGYMMEYAKPDSYAWSPVARGGVDSVRLTKPCAKSADAPDRVVYQAWSWNLTTEAEWITNLEAAIKTIQIKRPSAKRIDVMTIIRCPSNGFCHDDKPPHGLGADRDSARQDCHVPEYVDSAVAKVAAKYPALVGVAPKFESKTCNPVKINGIHLGEANKPVAKDIGEFFRSRP